MTIGHVVKLTNKEEGSDYREWQQLIIKPPFMERMSATLVENRSKKNNNEPDFLLFENITQRGDKERFNGKTFNARQVGAVWRRVSRDGKTNFLAGSIDTPLVYGGRFNFSLFETKIPEGKNPEDYFWLYDAVWNPYTKTNNSYSNSNNDYAEPTGYTSSPTGNNIPVYVENDDAYEYR